jgi:hypothetical protein
MPPLQLNGANFDQVFDAAVVKAARDRTCEFSDVDLKAVNAIQRIRGVDNESLCSFRGSLARILGRHNLNVPIDIIAPNDNDDYVTYRNRIAAHVGGY